MSTLDTDYCIPSLAASAAEAETGIRVSPNRIVVWINAGRVRSGAVGNALGGSVTDVVDCIRRDFPDARAA
nr:hypothetical protein [Rhodococcus sp. (in: high G+C Gram-positive bacteria)]